MDLSQGMAGKSKLPGKRRIRARLWVFLERTSLNTKGN